jgi:hypothetical protein
LRERLVTVSFRCYSQVGAPAGAFGMLRIPQ